jgi:hypothetical protein
VRGPNAQNPFPRNSAERFETSKKVLECWFDGVLIREDDLTADRGALAGVGIRSAAWIADHMGRLIKAVLRSCDRLRGLIPRVPTLGSTQGDPNKAAFRSAVPGM